MLSWIVAVPGNFFSPLAGAIFAVALGYGTMLPLLPVAAGVLYPLAIGQEVAAIATSGSSLLVAANALWLNRAGVQGSK